VSHLSWVRKVRSSISSTTFPPWLRFPLEQEREVSVEAFVTMTDLSFPLFRLPIYDFEVIGFWLGSACPLLPRFVFFTLTSLSAFEDPHRSPGQPPFPFNSTQARNSAPVDARHLRARSLTRGPSLRPFPLQVFPVLFFLGTARRFFFPV